MSKADIAKLDAATLEKMTADEVAEETRTLDAADAAIAAKRAVDAQAAKTKQAVADAAALDKARKVAVDDAEHAVTAVTAAKDALVAADALEARKNYPVSVFISAKTGRLVAKLGFVQVMDVPVTIADPGRPLGTHVLTATRLHQRREGAALERRHAEADRDGELFAPQEPPPRRRGASCRRRPRRRCCYRAGAHRYPQRGRGAARRAHEARLLAHHLRLRPQPGDERAHRVRRRALAQPPGQRRDPLLLIEFGYC
ncbi:MAG: hypothetical protein WDN31_10080 [Hyphomicrobium sp.]